MPIKRVKSFTPEKGHVSVLSITDKQYSNIIHIWGSVEKKSRPTPLQIVFFSIFAKKGIKIGHFVNDIRIANAYK